VPIYGIKKQGGDMRGTGGIGVFVSVAIKIAVVLVAIGFACLIWWGINHIRIV
jgi:hypothetical protein